MNNKLKCPVCGHDVEMYDICGVCNWQNSGPNEKEDDSRGPNSTTLRDARKAYEKNDS